MEKNPRREPVCPPFNPADVFCCVKPKPQRRNVLSLTLTFLTAGTVQRGGATIAVDAAGRGPTQRALARERDAWEGRDVALETEPRHPNVSVRRGCVASLSCVGWRVSPGSVKKFMPVRCASFCFKEISVGSRISVFTIRPGQKRDELKNIQNTSTNIAKHGGIVLAPQFDKLASVSVCSAFGDVKVDEHGLIAVRMRAWFCRTVSFRRTRE